MKYYFNMKTIILQITLSDDYKLKNVTITHNDTGIISSKSLLTAISETIIESIELDDNKDDLNEFLSELKIKKIS